MHRRSRASLRLNGRQGRAEPLRCRRLRAAPGAGASRTGLWDRLRTFAASIGVGSLPEPEGERVLTTQRIDQALVLDHWFKPLAEDPSVLRAEFDALLDRVTGPYLWLAGGPVETADRDHLLSHVAQAHIETWSNLGHMAHLAEPDKFVARLSQFAVNVRNGDT